MPSDCCSHQYYSLHVYKTSLFTYIPQKISYLVTQNLQFTYFPQILLFPYLPQKFTN